MANHMPGECRSRLVVDCYHKGAYVARRASMIRVSALQALTTWAKPAVASDVAALAAHPGPAGGKLETPGNDEVAGRKIHAVVHQAMMWEEGIGARPLRTKCVLVDDISLPIGRCAEVIQVARPPLV